MIADSNERDINFKRSFSLYFILCSIAILKRNRSNTAAVDATNAALSPCVCTQTMAKKK